MKHFSENFWVFVVLEFKETGMWSGTAAVYLVFRYCRNMGKKENKYSITPLIRINWDGEPSGHAENPNNWTFL